jgi:hypothetical protein
MAETRDVTIQVRLTEDEHARLLMLGMRHKAKHSDILKIDGGINTSAVVRHLIAGDLSARR